MRRQGESFGAGVQWVNHLTVWLINKPYGIIQVDEESRQQGQQRIQRK